MGQCWAWSQNLFKPHGVRVTWTLESSNSSQIQRTALGDHSDCKLSQKDVETSLFFYSPRLSIASKSPANILEPKVSHNVGNSPHHPRLQPVAWSYSFGALKWSFSFPLLLKHFSPRAGQAPWHCGRCCAAQPCPVRPCWPLLHIDSGSQRAKWLYLSAVWGVTIEGWVCLW